MSGEGHITAKLPAWSFDQRPGALEASRGLSAPRAGLMACGSRGSISQGWTVLVLATGEDGGFCHVPLSIEDARAAAAEITEMCELLEGKRW